MLTVALCTSMCRDVIHYPYDPFQVRSVKTHHHTISRESHTPRQPRHRTAHGGSRATRRIGYRRQRHAHASRVPRAASGKARDTASPEIACTTVYRLSRGGTGGDRTRSLERRNSTTHRKTQHTRQFTV